MKKILFSLILFMLTLFSANAADFYSTYDLNFQGATPASMFVTGAECLDNACTTVNLIRPVELFNGDRFTACYNTFTSNSDETAFISCIDNARIVGNVVNLATTSSIVTRVTTPSTFGYVTYFSPSADSYHVKYDRMTNLVCTFDICVDTNRAVLNFVKTANATAEIGQLNIINVDDFSKPVQVTVPVSIQESVCSAFKFSEANMYRFTIPFGYSDYNADTLVALKITDNLNGSVYLNQSIEVPIEADTCAGLAAFSWTPSANLENRSVTFRVDTDVVDNQVSSSIADFSEVTETIYPINLDGTCWTRSYDMTLSNVPSFFLNTQLAQITEGETLYLGFNGAAYRDNAMTPMGFSANVYFNGTLVATGNFPASNSLQSNYLDLSSDILGLPPGAYNVTLVTTPVGAFCTMLASVNQTQNLQILVADSNRVTFHVRDSNFSALNNAAVNLVLTSADDYYQITPVYNFTINTNAFGTAVFNNVISGNYEYSVSNPGLVTVNGVVHVASNTDIYITLPAQNVAPVVNLPLEMTEYYLNTAVIDLTNYITDYNDLYSSLTVTYNIVSGTVSSSSYVGGNLFVSTTLPNDVVIRVTAVDPSGFSSNDTITIHFVNNQAPVINQFLAQPDNGQVNLTTSFLVNVVDLDADPLTCTLEFGDGQQITQNCNTINGVSHTYTNVGTYNAILRVNDGITTEVTEIEQVFVFQRLQSSPQIGYFNLTSSNGIYIPTNVVLTWDVTHPDSLAMTCTLRINAVNTLVPCSNGVFNLNNLNTTGTTRFTLVADDGTNQDIRIIDLTLFDPAVSGPVVNFFTLTTATGNFLVPNNLTLNYGVTHPQNLPMACTITINSVSTPVLCTPAGTFTVTDFNVTGVSTFIFTADDGTVANNITLNQLFVSSTNNTVNLSLALVDLILEDTIVPGEFEFGVSILNETLNSRELKFKPFITCEGAVLGLENNPKGFIDSSAISKEERAEGFVYKFKLDTLKFSGLIPTDKNCRFTITVVDEYGTNVDVSQSVMFSYENAPQELQSIRGKGTDIVDFMSSALSNEIKPGYNAIEFKVANNEFVDKDLTITLISQNLGISYTEKLSLASGQERTVTIPLYIEKNTKKGSYPVRFSVYDENDKQVRYSYIIVG